MTKAIFRRDGVLTAYGTGEAIKIICTLKPLFEDKSPHEAAALLHLVVEEVRALATEDAQTKKTCDTCGWLGQDEECEHEGDCPDYVAWKPPVD